MSCSQKRLSLPASTRFELHGKTIELAFAAALLVSVASFVALSVGDPELMALVAVTGFAVVVLGLAVVRLFEYHQRYGVRLSNERTTRD